MYLILLIVLTQVLFWSFVVHRLDDHRVNRNMKVTRQSTWTNVSLIVEKILKQELVPKQLDIPHRRKKN